MNVFQDLVVELQDENLLEKTIIDVEGHDNVAIDDLHFSEVSPASYDLSQTETHQSGITAPSVESAKAAYVVVEDVEAEKVPVDNSDTLEVVEVVEPVVPKQEPTHKKPQNGKEFYRKRAVGEVSNLQMVEHVLTGVEREYMKIVPHAFDDFNVKKALHSFLHVDENENSGEHTESEFTLMQETEAWCTALAERDRSIPVSNLRQYCENSRPALSSQALLALARFYRNLPYSEGVRSKFDFVITRLFSRPTEQEKRVCLFTRDETLVHVNTLYREWSSIALYSAEDDESKVLLTALSFEDLAIEAENASSFDQLIENDFFGRLRIFKESISELFYAPNVTAAAIECNIRIGNAYVNLIARERQKMDDESIQTKYGDLNDQVVSDAAARTLALVEILRESPSVVETVESPSPVAETVTDESPVAAPAVVESKPKTAKLPYKFLTNLIDNAFEVNKWFLAFAVIIISASVGLYFWSNFAVQDEATTAGVKAVELEGSILKDHIKTARISGETFYALMLPSWDLLPKEKRLEYLQKVYQAAKESGCNQVSLTSKDGKNAGYASATRMEVSMP